MLVILGFGMILTFMVLIMTKRLSPAVALIAVPTIFALFTGIGWGLGDAITPAVKSLAPTMALLTFAIVFFGTMLDVGLFDPLVRGITKVCGTDPVKIVVGTAVLAAVVSLDGDGSTTFIVVTSALLPIYLKMGLSPVVLTCVAGLANGTMNIIPWGGPTVRAAAALQVSATDVFVPMLPSLGVGLLVMLAFAWHLGVLERRRLATANGFSGSVNTEVLTTVSQDSLVSGMLDPDREKRRPKLFWFNAVLTLAVLVLLVVDVLPLYYVFMLGTALALIVNFPKPSAQFEQLVAHASSVLSVVSMVMAAAVLIGVLDGTGMVDAMSNWLVSIIPSSLGPYLAVITGVLSIPMTFFISNDAFYYGMLPVLAQSAQQFGIEPVEMARASIIGQPFHLQSPLVPAILLLVTLAKVDLGDHHKKVLWRAAAVSIVMLVVGVLVGVIPFG
ncbi:CitMHS family transporter [Pseudoclavibacter sp. CFCC 11306]|uniref:CitMHS family transporter n=1 Tax=Pseudoclavibacter sp. CFCC 11306 TaxID=1564493 RepID=UPI001300F1E8|nr:citrate:proton symporter [Pseudoclavibacter sp. CFCC 11306]KAB1658836.1 citrate:proton symporter [Pseudoclavibacter sp. CFCC 11306]